MIWLCQITFAGVGPSPPHSWPPTMGGRSWLAVWPGPWSPSSWVLSSASDHPSGRSLCRPRHLDLRPADGEPRLHSRLREPGLGAHLAAPASPPPTVPSPTCAWRRSSSSRCSSSICGARPRGSRSTRCAGASRAPRPRDQRRADEGHRGRAGGGAGGDRRGTARPGTDLRPARRFRHVPRCRVAGRPGDNRRALERGRAAGRVSPSHVARARPGLPPAWTANSRPSSSVSAPCRRPNSPTGSWPSRAGGCAACPAPATTGRRWRAIASSPGAGADAAQSENGRRWRRASRDDGPCGTAARRSPPSK